MNSELRSQEPTKIERIEFGIFETNNVALQY